MKPTEKKLMFRTLLSLFLWLAGSSLLAGPSGLPVLPYPRFVTEGSEKLDLTMGVRLTSTTLEKEVLDRLRSHSVRGVTGNVTVELVLLDKRPAPPPSPLLRAHLDSIGREGYLMELGAGGNTISAFTETGLFYGLQSLRQLTRAGWNTALSIADWPSFETRVIYDDISRGPVPNLEYVKRQIERLAELKVNYLSFYIEHVVQPLSHPDFAPENGKLTIADIRELSAYAAQHHMQLIGSFQSFGHFEKILSLPQYASMGETNTLISPLDARARDFLEKVIGELCDAFNAPWFNVNCDETFDLNKGKSKAYIDSIGPGRFYADHIRFLYDVVRRHDKKMMMWGDIALEHPEILDDLPRDIVYLTWEYGDQANYDRWIEPFVARGLNFMVCPGILNSYRMFPDMVMAKGNIKGFLEAGAKAGASGAFTTIWDDGGTYLFSGDWYGVYRAAEKSWNIAAAPELTFDSRYGKVAYGADNTHYVDALFKLMALRKLTLTYNLGDQLWSQQLLSRKNGLLQLNNSSVPQAVSLLDEAASLVRAAGAKYNGEDLEALLLSIRQYRLIMDLRTTVVSAASAYRSARISEVTARKKILRPEVRRLREVAKRTGTLLEDFSQAWRQENQEHWLDVVASGYKSKISALDFAAGKLDSLLASVPAELPAPEKLGLRIEETPYTYFQNWLLTGPFPMDTENGKSGLPPFLYSEGTEYNQPPIPGGISLFEGVQYRWRKFASPDGGQIHLGQYFGQNEGVAAYAYCTLRIGEEKVTEAWINAPAGAEVYCNGEKIATMTGTGEQRFPFYPAQHSLHRILLKIPAGGTPWLFTFRIGNNLEVVNQKHKYQINSNQKVYEAE